MGYAIQTDFSQIDPNEGAGQSLPVSDSNGWLVEMIASDPKPNSAGNGQILACQLRGLDGPVQGKLHDFTINLANPSQKAVEIGLGEMSAIAHVTGHIRVGNTSEWHHKPFRVVIMPEIDKETKQPTGRNRIAKFLDTNGNGPKDAGKGAMGSGFQQNGGQQAQNNGGFQQNNGQQGNGFQQNQNQNGGFGNQAQGQQGSGQGGQGFDNNQNGGGGFQQQQGQNGGGFSNGQTGQQNAQGGTPNPGSQFQPNGQGGGFDQNAGQGGGFQPNGQNGGGFQQNNGGANPGGWSK